MVSGQEHTSCAVVIVAAGSGSRYGADMPKQFLNLAGRPVLRHCIDTFREALPEAETVVVLSPTGRAIWDEYRATSGYEGPAVAEGGDTRSQSVLNGLLALKARGVADDAIVFIHDGARPLVSRRIISDIARAFRDGCQAAAPAVRLTDSIATVNGADATAPVDRDSLRALQTPQTFRLGQITAVMTELIENDLRATDECGAFMQLTGREVRMLEGERANIKITNPGDLAIAELYLRC